MCFHNQMVCLFPGCCGPGDQFPMPEVSQKAQRDDELPFKHAERWCKLIQGHFLLLHWSLVISFLMPNHTTGFTLDTLNIWFTSDLYFNYRKKIAVKAFLINMFNLFPFAGWIWLQESHCGLYHQYHRGKPREQGNRLGPPVWVYRGLRAHRTGH